MALVFHCRALGAALLAVALGAAGARAQTPEVQTTETPVRFSTGVNLVPVKVVVRGRDGRAVGGLKQSDFELRDNGRTQTIARFSVEETEPYRPHVVAVPTDAAGRERPDLAPRNAREPAAIPERFIAYIFDDVHTDMNDLMRSREAAVGHLERVLDPGTRVAVFTTSGTVRQDFTDDLDAVTKTMRAVRRWTADLETDNCPPLNYYWANLILNGNDPEAWEAAVQETFLCVIGIDRQTAEQITRSSALRELAKGKRESAMGLSIFKDAIRRMGALPGRREIVYVSAGFFLDRDLRIDQNEIFDRAIRANVTIHALDARGLYGVVPGGDAGRGGKATTALITTFKQRMEKDLALAAANVMGELASATGGTFVWNSNDYQAGFERLAAAPEFAYVLAFSPRDLKNDGAFHEVKVTLKNHKGLEVSARGGYFAPSAEADAAETVREEIRDAVFSRGELAGIPVDMSLQYFKSADLEAKLTVQAKLDVASLKFKKAGDRNHDVLTVVSAVFDRNGNFVKGVQRVLDMKLRDQTLARLIEQREISVRSTLDLEPGSYLVRLVVRDGEGKTMAARNGAVEIPY
jgi:VWFA-related protein